MVLDSIIGVWGGIRDAFHGLIHLGVQVHERCFCFVIETVGAHLDRSHTRVEDLERFDNMHEATS